MDVIYPGSFDPVTNGHIDIIERCSKKFSKVIVSVLDNHSKHSMFTVDERKKLLIEVTKEFENVEIDSFSGLLVDYIKEKKVSTVVRGLRAVSDFEYEMQMALTNKNLYDKMETIFLISSSQFSFLSSSIVKEVALFNGDISGFVPKYIEDAIKEKTRGFK